MSVKNGHKGAFFQEHINKFKTMKHSAFTHTSIMNPIAAFYIPGGEEKDFIHHYNEALKKGEKIHFTEKHRDVAPILLDLDFRFYNKELFQKRQFDDQFIKKIVTIYVTELNKYVVTDTFEVYVSQKPAPCIDPKKNVIKDGVHIIIPNVVTKLSLQLKIRELVLEKLSFLKTDLKTTNSVDDIFDKAVIDKNNWTMYGSRKPYNEPYTVNQHMTVSLDTTGSIQVNLNTVSKDLWEYTSLFSIRNKFKTAPLQKEQREMILQWENDYQDRMTKTESIRKTQQNKENVHLGQSDSYDMSSKLMNILSVERASNYNTWISVGWCARNIDNRLLENWIQFSKRSSKFVDDVECENLWRYMKDSGLGIGTLCMWAKQDNPEEYSNIISQSLYSLLMVSKSDTDYDIAMVIYNKFKQDFICASIKYKSWYEFKKHRWVKCEEGYILKMKMSTEVAKEYLRIYSELAKKAIDIEDDNEQKVEMKKATVFKNISLKLKKTDFKDKMLKECSSQFFNEKFEDDLLDANPNLIGFENGVYDLLNMEFREGHPEDFISFSTKINYVEYDPGDPYVDQIMDFMSKVLPKKEIREYMLTLMASMLDGNNKEEKFYIWTGHGSNGKSKCIELLEKALGDYACTFNISLLTNKRVGSSQTNSELVRAKGRRFAVLQEPEEGEKMNAGFMKELSGNDKIIARGLYKESIEFKPMFKMVLTCNHLPQVPPEDGGTWRRIRLVEFKSHFCDNPDPENENDFHIDRELAFKFEEWKETFMSMLIHYFKRYKAYGIFEPEEVLQCTKNYQRSNDVMGEFMDEFVERDKDGFVYLDELYDEYREWHKAESVSGKVVRKKVIKDYLDKHFNKSVSKDNKFCWAGYKLKFSYKGIIVEDDDDSL
jgi:P4 family phage/plasmid primase-like protien